jgi:rhodanese-related sulfurtransferase
LRKLATFLWLGLLVLPGCRADFTGLETLEVAELVALRQTQPDLVLCDANSDDTRNRLGFIPGAVLLSSYRDYDPHAELSGDLSRKVVFYCHSEMCGAAADAARKAVAAGYSNVSVLASGIRGWAEAGQPVDRSS